MNISQVDEKLITQINQGSEQAFATLYKAYYSYLNTIAIYYLFDKNVGSEVVDDVFLNIWLKRKELTYPVNSYLIRSVQNGCLNYIRMQGIRQSVLDEHTELQLAFLEENVQSTPVPLQYIELKETEAKIREGIDQLPPKCRQVFEAYFYSGLSPDEIADKMNLTVSTVRVQIKNAMDKLKQTLSHLLFIIFFV